MTRSLLLLAMFCSVSALADSSVPVIDSAVIDSSGQNYQGNLSVNQASGDQQQQTNNRAIAIGNQASASTPIQQQLQTHVDRSLNASVAIQGNAFSHGSGITGINQSAGESNQQANAVRISISAQPQSIDDSVLVQQNVALLNGSDATGPSSGSRQVSTSDQAFTGSSGVIQLNQSAGVGNRMGNTLGVRVTE